MKLDPYFRKDNHNKMTFNVMYAFSENFVLVLSHDEVVHLKCSMLYKMPGDLETKAMNLKSAYTFMMGQPGKKLLFMGQEFGQREEWSEARGLDWYLLDDPLHKDIREYYKKLLHLYKEYPVMYAYESKEYGCYQWINCDDNENSVFSFLRKAPDTYDDSLAFVCNFTPVERNGYVIGVPHPGTYDGTREVTYKAVKCPKGEEINYFPYKLTIDIRPLESIIMKVPKLVIRKTTRKSTTTKAGVKKPARGVKKKNKK